MVEGEGLDPRAVVVNEDARFAGRLLAPGSAYVIPDVVLPIGAVVRASPERVDLGISASEVRRQPPYLTYHLRPPSRTEAAIQFLAVATSGPAMPVMSETAAKSAGEMEIDQGENVMLGQTGRLLGHVQGVLFDGGELIGIVMKPAGFFKKDVVLPVRFLGRSDDMALFAHLTDADLDHLQPAES